jgi:hypothetical protein
MFTITSNISACSDMYVPFLVLNESESQESVSASALYFLHIPLISLYLQGVCELAQLALFTLNSPQLVFANFLIPYITVSF